MNLTSEKKKKSSSHESSVDSVVSQFVLRYAIARSVQYFSLINSNKAL